MRARNIHGAWTLKPTADGKSTLVSYSMYNEPGGQVPSWIFNLAQRNAPRALVLAMTKRALEDAKAK